MLNLLYYGCHIINMQDNATCQYIDICLFQLDDIAQVVHNLSYNKQNWKDVEEKYPKFEQQESKGV